MSKEIIKHTITQHFKTIKEQINRMTSAFGEEPIHLFRTGIKKLRAFLRLINAGRSKKKASISKKLKVYYWYAGNIRNLQLHEKAISSGKEELPRQYLNHTRKQVEALKGALQALHAPSNFEKLNSIVKRVTARKLPVKKFIHEKISEFQSLIAEAGNDEMIHAIRKILKDLLYNWKYIKHQKKLLPSGISSKKKLQEITDLLGDYCDRATGGRLIETYLLTSGDGEKDILQKILNTWNEEKERLGLRLAEMLHSPA